MAKISEKYLAGLIDSDGCFCFGRVIKNRQPKLTLNITQRKDHAKVLYDVQETFGGKLYERAPRKRCPNPVVEWHLHETQAKMLIARLLQHLVIKRDYAQWVLEVTSKPLGMDSIEFNKIRKEKRNSRCTHEKNFPSRKWLAGYFDGDGTVGVSYVTQDNRVILRFGITAHKKDSIGIELIKKNFGGAFSDTSKDNSCYQWTLYLSDKNSSQGKNFLDYFFKHCVIKHNQLLAVKEYLNSDNPNGLLLRDRLKQLKNPLAETKSIEG